MSLQSFSKQVQENKRKRGWQDLAEAAYPGNLGFEEMIKFYRKASSQEEKEMDKIIKNKDMKAFKKLVQKVLGVKLK